MQLTDFLHENRHHLTVTVELSPELEKRLSALTDALTAAVTAVNTSLATLTTEVGDAITEITSLQSGPDQAAVQAAITALGTVKSGLDALSSDIEAKIAPPVAATLTVLPSGPLPTPVPGTPFDVPLTIAGGVGPYTVSTTGNPPSGLNTSVSGDTAAVSDPTPTASSPPVNYVGTVAIADSASPANTVSVSFDWTF
jgi:hypothetical protein